MNNAAEPANETKKTLMNSVGSLDNISSQVNDLVNLSRRILDKLHRVDNRPREEVEMAKGSDPDPRQPNIIDLFNNISAEMEENINIIGNNLQTIMDMIE